MTTMFDKLAYDAAQRARIAWFFGQKMLAARLSRPLPLPETLRGRPMPDRRRILADLRALIEQDWRNIEAGYYRPPQDWPSGLIEELRNAVDFFADLGAVERRRHGGIADDLPEADAAERYPPYYLRNFHFQTDGYLSAASAERYDHQVEVLFGGGAGAMRRQALVPLREALLDMRAAGVVRPKLLDVGCGTGAFLREVKTNYPRLAVAGLDLSAPYLAVAGRRLKPWSRVELVEANAEATPFTAAEFDIVTCIYLFHELPPRARRTVVEEVHRVLRPGGLVIFVDSLQSGDQPDYDAMLEWFPVAFHEPYYASYLREDLDRLWQPGFRRAGGGPAYLSKVLTYRRKAEPGSTAGGRSCGISH